MVKIRTYSTLHFVVEADRLNGRIGYESPDMICESCDLQTWFGIINSVLRMNWCSNSISNVVFFVFSNNHVDITISMLWFVVISYMLPEAVIARRAVFEITKHPLCARLYMMTSSNGNIFRVTGPLCGEFTSPVNSPHKGQWRGALMFSLICVWMNGWVNNGEAGDLRRHRGHYDVNIMNSVTDYRLDWSLIF